MATKSQTSYHMKKNRKRLFELRIKRYEILLTQHSLLIEERRRTQDYAFTFKVDVSCVNSVVCLTGLPSATKQKWWRILWTQCGRLLRFLSGRCVTETMTGTDNVYTAKSSHRTYFIFIADLKKCWNISETSPVRLICTKRTQSKLQTTYHTLFLPYLSDFISHCVGLSQADSSCEDWLSNIMWPTLYIDVKIEMSHHHQNATILNHL